MCITTKTISSCIYVFAAVVCLLICIYIYLQMYTFYANNYGAALEQLREQKRNPAFVEFVAARQQMNGAPLEALLISPIQRIPRYVLLLQVGLRL